jgi:hypothetical protein
MGKIETLRDIEEKIEEIKNRDFKIEDFNLYGENHKICTLLRNAQICNNAIYSINDISKEERKELHKLLDELMKSKFKKLNPSFSEEVLNNMTNAYKRSFIYYPMDILIVDDAVFHKEGVYDDFGSIYKIRTLMFKNMKPYYDVLDMEFILNHFNLYRDFGRKQLTKDDYIYTSDFISNSINSIYGEKITKPIYKLNDDKTFYGSKGINVIGGINIYLNMQFNDIGRSLKSGNECDIKLCIKKEDDITLYYIHQSFKDNKPIWDVVKTNNEIWKLTDEALKLDNKSESKILTKK